MARRSDRLLPSHIRDATSPFVSGRFRIAKRRPREVVCAPTPNQEQETQQLSQKSPVLAPYWLVVDGCAFYTEAKAQQRRCSGPMR